MHALAASAASTSVETALDTLVVSSAMADSGARIAWGALEKGTPVYSSDGKELGKVAEVVADAGKDIFSGITLNPGLFRDERFVPADLVADMTAESVTLRIGAGAAADRLKQDRD